MALSFTSPVVVRHRSGAALAAPARAICGALGRRSTPPSLWVIGALCLPRIRDDNGRLAKSAPFRMESSMVTEQGSQKDSTAQSEYTQVVQRVSTLLHFRAQEKLVWRPALSDVDKISRGKAAGTRGVGSRAVPHRLNEEERKLYDLATKKKGFLAVKGTGYRKERKGAPALNTFRQWCDARAKPWIVVQKYIPGLRDPLFTRNGQPCDQLLIDMATLRLRPSETRLLLRATAACLAHSFNVHAVSTPQDDDPQENPCSQLIMELDTAANEASSRPGEFQQSPIWDLEYEMLQFQADREVAKQLAGFLADIWQVAENT
ncbi:hypothetical protein FVE85_5217 [Porphyridium purpureum]|uniref:Uncharacterized protein n=1 Tax=Porphyridium purpureum TaxID=35688 RepID=A0A5J4Z366_PORPP|nr:hypothetical protein FVE85_5217 [Porphyridium purpureum]|eukprot:POR4959..scf295_1